MAPQCAICLSDLRNPVCTPCGHVFCSDCLTRAIAPTTNGFQTSCPCCRKVFPIAIPDARYLPEQFRPFVVNPIRSVYFTTDDPHDRSDIIQRNESLERENENLRARIRELEADGSEEEGSDPQVDSPLFVAHPDTDAVLSEVASNLANSMYVATNSTYPRSAPLFRPETQFIPPPNPNPTRTGAARPSAPVSSMGPNRPALGQTIFGTLTFSGPETRANLSTASARPSGPVGFSMPSTMGTSMSGPAGFTNPFSRSEPRYAAPSTPAPYRGTGQSSTVHPSYTNTGSLSFSRADTQWTVPSNPALNMPNQSAPAPVFNITGISGYTFSRRQSHPRMATPAPLGPGSSAMASTTADVPVSSPESGAEN
ncbi:hypothetical protein DFS33DRAFT_906456 [Desarmillaria ectypa]|nr:hypothetical protein DFS33DRAFT_906456 [Desarmillaria ectypa]